MSDIEKIKVVSYAIDDYTKELMDRAEMSPMAVSAVIVARLVLLNDATGTGDKFRQLLAEVAQMPIKGQETIQ